MLTFKELFLVIFSTGSLFAISYLTGYLLISHCDTTKCNYNPLNVKFLQYLFTGLFFIVSISIDFMLYITVMYNLHDVLINVNNHSSIFSKSLLFIFTIISIVGAYFLSILLSIVVDKDHFKPISSETVEWFPIMFSITMISPFIFYFISICCIKSEPLINPLINPSINTINQPINQQNNQPINQPINQQNNQQNNQSRIQSNLYGPILSSINDDDEEQYESLNSIPQRNNLF